MLDKKLETQNDMLSAIHSRLREFGNQHEGIWVYGSGDDTEVDFRESIAAAEKRKDKEMRDSMDFQLYGGQSGRLP